MFYCSFYLKLKVGFISIGMFVCLFFTQKHIVKDNNIVWCEIWILCFFKIHYKTKTVNDNNIYINYNWTCVMNITFVSIRWEIVLITSRKEVVALRIIMIMIVNNSSDCIKLCTMSYNSKNIVKLLYLV